jgi:4-amino-4-deoxy-L-arabinose transferase-like glycosyltransferase
MTYRRTLWIVALAALAVRIVAAVAIDGFRHPDLNEYDSLARALVSGHGFVYYHIGIPYYSYAPPMDAWIGAASYWLTGSLVLKMALQIAMGTALAVTTAILAARVFGGWLAPLAAGLLVAVHPGLVIYNVSKSHPLSADALFFTLALLATVRLYERPITRRALALGAIVGIGAFSRATIVVFLPIAALWLLASKGGPEGPPLRSAWPSWSVAVRNGVVAGLVAAAIIAPWTIRNTLLHHRFVFMLTTDGDDFWRGNNPKATGHSYVGPGEIVLNSLPPEEMRDLESQPNELAQADWFWRHARAFIRQHPDQFVRLTLLKFYSFWWFAPQTGVLYPGSWRALYMAYYSGVVLLAALGAWSVRRRGPPATQIAVVIAAFLLGLSALQSLYYVEGRHRWAVEPMLIVLSGGGAAALLERRLARRRAPEPAPLP